MPDNSPGNSGFQLPVVFIENIGQLTDMNDQPVPDVLYFAQMPGKQIFITTKGITFLLLEKQTIKNGIDAQKIYNWERIDMFLEGAQIRKENILKTKSLQSKYHYYNFLVPDGVQTTLATTIIVKEIYPGIDWEIGNTNANGFKYNFIVNPYADPNDIKIQYASGKQLELNNSGEIIMHSQFGDLTEHAPKTYNNQNELIASSFIKNKNDINNTLEVQFNIGEYDQTKQLIIDPELYWCTYYGGAMEECFNSVTSDADGNLFLTGWTDSPNFPVLNAGTYYQGTKGANEDAFILKFSPAHALIWATFYGGNEEDWGYSIATDNLGNVFVSGETVSTNFPKYNAGTFYQGALNGDEDVFILKFDNDGNRLWATYYGGSNKEGGYSICTDNANNIFVTGYTSSADFPKLNAGTFYQAAKDGSEDLFVLKFSNSGVRLWATFYGGNLLDNGNAIACDASGNVFVTGTTNSTNFPTQNAGTFFQGTLGGVEDAFVLKFTNSGTRLWATHYGGNLSDFGHSITTDIFENIFISGYTASTNFPTLDNATFFQSANAGGTDAYLVKFDNTGSRLWSTYLGGTGDENMIKWDGLASDICNNVYTTFTSFSPDMPLFDAGCSSYYDGIYAGFGDIYLSRFTNDGIQTWATYFGFEDEDLNSCIGISNLDGKSLYMTGQYNEYDPGEAVPLVNPGGGAYYDGTHNGDDESFIAEFIPVPLAITTLNSMLCMCTDTAIAIPDCGIEPYTFLWSDGQTTQTAIDLCEGIYSVVVTDADCSVDSATIEIVCLLPVTLTSFNGYFENNTNKLSWKTETEINNHYFTIEKMLENNTFFNIGEIPGAGNSTDANQYYFYDENPSSGNNYYRLKQTDFNGKILYSDVINVEAAAPNTNSVFPNPVSGELHIQLNNTFDSDQFIVELFNTSSLLVKRIVFDQSNQMSFSVDDINPGIYFIKVLNGNTTRIFEKLIITE